MVIALLPQLRYNMVIALLPELQYKHGDSIVTSITL